MKNESNPIWREIAPAPKALWSSAGEVIAAYRRTEPRTARSQRYSLVMTEPECPFHAAGNQGPCRYCEDQ